MSPASASPFLRRFSPALRDWLTQGLAINAVAKKALVILMFLDLGAVFICWGFWRLKNCDWYLAW
jgi:hypothetical protein